MLKMFARAGTLSPLLRGILTESACSLKQACQFSTSEALSMRPGIIFKDRLWFTWRWAQAGIDLSKYTHKPIPLVKYGGRGPDGRVWYKHVSGGVNKEYIMVDYKRSANPDGSPKQEKVVNIMKHPCRTACLALTISGSEKRWRIATRNMKVGQILTNYAEIPPIPVVPREGDSYPVGALPIGTVVSQVEVMPEEGSRVALAAGTSCVITRTVALKGSANALASPSATAKNENKQEEVGKLSKPGTMAGQLTVGRVALRMGNKREMEIDPRCRVVVGQVSNVEHASIPIGSPNRLRQLGIKQRSGLFQKKTGRFGRKIKPIPKPIVYDVDQPPAVKPTEVQLHHGHERAPKPAPQVVHFYGVPKDERVEPCVGGAGISRFP